MNRSFKARIVVGLAGFDVALAASQVTSSMPWFKWAQLAAVSVVFALSIVGYFKWRRVQWPLAILATLTAVLAVIAFKNSAWRAVDHVGLLAQVLTAVVAWHLISRRPEK